MLRCKVLGADLLSDTPFSGCHTPMTLRTWARARRLPVFTPHWFYSDWLSGDSRCGSQVKMRSGGSESQSDRLIIATYEVIWQEPGRFLLPLSRTQTNKPARATGCLSASGLWLHQEDQEKTGLLNTKQPCHSLLLDLISNGLIHCRLI